MDMNLVLERMLGIDSWFIFVTAPYSTASTDHKSEHARSP